MNIAVAMSGGVDSTVCASLLKSEGHNVTGFTALMYDGGDVTVHNAKVCAQHIGIEHIVLDLRDEFNKRIIEPFVQSYLNGRTPSPCIRCNRLIKFGLILDSIIEAGIEQIATGHYAAIHRDNKRFYLSQAKDPVRDQSYFLFDLTQEQLKHILFPLANFSKDEIRNIATTHGLPAAKSKDSQEICFIPDNDYRGFIQDRCKTPDHGDITDKSGKSFKKHDGIYRYTIGQRRGLGISHSEPLYVTDIIPEENRIIAGPKTDLFKNGLIAGSINFMKQSAFNNDNVFAKIRSTQPAIPAKATILENGKLELIFEQPTMQISPGQAAVLYDNKSNLLAGGWIESAF
ncbi:MAG: tRNA 2-thiouridine(34) synthase MnmA [Spirochaetes bacterium]|nr:tRNA 2-thiouridine(34) synthase MnmA [Spirochaetota bacterium]